MTGDGRGRRLGLPMVAVALAAVVGFVIWLQAARFDWLVARAEVLAVSMLAIGVAVRSERLVAAASAPALLGLVLGATDQATIAWGRALVVGSLWYLATEAALSSVEWSGDLRVTAGVLQRRLGDVATVVVVGAAVGLTGVGLTALAPDRTIAARGLVLALVLVGLLIGARRLITAGPVVRAEAGPADDVSSGRPAER